MKTNYTEEEAYELALKWLPKIEGCYLPTDGQLLNLAFKIWSGDISIHELEALIAPPEE